MERSEARKADAEGAEWMGEGSGPVTADGRRCEGGDGQRGGGLGVVSAERVGWKSGWNGGGIEVGWGWNGGSEAGGKMRAGVHGRVHETPAPATGGVARLPPVFPRFPGGFPATP